MLPGATVSTTRSRPAANNDMTEHILSVRGLTKAFDAVVVASNIDFDVRRGEVLGVIGPNGAGKTTLFGMLSGHIKPSAGELVFEGRAITDLAPYQRARAGIGRTFQVPRPFGHMTVEDNLRVCAAFAGKERGRGSGPLVEQVLAATGLAPQRAMLASHLPLLLRKRLELAKALAMKPRLLLIDEVAAGLTDSEVSEFIDIVKSVRDRGISVVWIEHVIRTMMTATDRLMVLDQGQILAIGDPQDVMKQSEVRRVYLGSE